MNNWMEHKGKRKGKVIDKGLNYLFICIQRVLDCDYL